VAENEKSVKPWSRELAAVPRARATNGESSSAIALPGTATAAAATSSALVPRALDQEQGLCFVRFSPRPPFDPRLVFTDQDAKRAAAFRLLRQRLLDRDDATAQWCTSPHPGEGKTTLAANLALAMSEPGRYRVLLLEANFRNASLASMFGFEPPKGFRAQIIRHRNHPEDPWVLIQIGPPPLYIMAAERNACPRCATVLPDDARFCGKCGATITGAGAAFDSAGFAAAIERFRQAFDYVIIDAPSVLSGGDVSLIQDSADVVVLAVRQGLSDERSLRRAVDQLAPVTLAGVTMFEE